MNTLKRWGLPLLIAIGLPLLFRAWFLGEQMETFTWQLHKSTFVADALFIWMALPNLLYLAYLYRRHK
jgi:hypothetical protein